MLTKSLLANGNVHGPHNAAENQNPDFETMYDIENSLDLSKIWSNLKFSKHCHITSKYIRIMYLKQHV